MRIFAVKAVGFALFVGSLQAGIITFENMNLTSAALAGTNPNKLTLVAAVGGVTNGTSHAVLNGAHLTFLTGDVIFSSFSSASGFEFYSFTTVGSSRVLLGGSTTPAIPAGTTLMSGVGNGGASLLFTRTGITPCTINCAGTWTFTAPSSMDFVDPALAAFLGIESAPNPGDATLSSVFSFNGRISSYGNNSKIGTPLSAFQGQFSLISIPEPATMSLIGLGLAGLALLRRRMNS